MANWSILPQPPLTLFPCWAGEVISSFLENPPGEIPLAPLVIPSSNLLRGFVGQTRGPHGDSGQRKWSEHIYVRSKNTLHQVISCLPQGWGRRLFQLADHVLGARASGWGQQPPGTVTTAHFLCIFKQTNTFEAFYGRPLMAVNTRISESCLFV